uniref:Uncharacterized protein n=1 Tax=Chlorobium phaeobacteroides (strain BS1) TaxID=331678 RepID=B3EQE9_CHLPB
MLKRLWHITRVLRKKLTYQPYIGASKLLDCSGLVDHQSYLSKRTRLSALIPSLLPQIKLELLYVVQIAGRTDACHFS